MRYTEKLDGKHLAFGGDIKITAGAPLPAEDPQRACGGKSRPRKMARAMELGRPHEALAKTTDVRIEENARQKSECSI